MRIRTTLGELRQLIKEEAMSAKTLKTWAEKSKNEDDQVLLSVGLIPIPRNADEFYSSGYIASGAYSSVHEVLFNGKRAVAKMTSKEEARNYASWRQVRENAPEIVKRHMVDVWEIGEIPTRKDNPSYSDYVVVEPLVPMAKGEAALFTAANDLDQATNEFNRIMKIVHNSQSDWDDRFDFLSSEERDAAFKGFCTAVKKIIDSTVKKTSATRRINMFLLNPPKDVKQEINPNWLSRFSTIYAGYIDNLIQTIDDSVNDIVPISSQENLNKDAIKENRPARELYTALNWLDKKAHVEWEDLHSANVMKRAGSDVLVISDPGMFFGL